MSDQQFEECLRECIKMNNGIISKLKSLKDVMNTHRETCNKVKTFGTTVGTIGTVGLVGSVIAAPFTGGLSLVIAGSGLGLSVVGGAANITTDVVDGFKTSDTVKTINKLVDSKKELSERFERLVTEIMNSHEKLMDSEDILTRDYTDDVTTAFAQSARLTNAVNSFAKIEKVVDIAPKALAALQMGGKVAGQTAVKLVGKASIVLSVATTVIDIGLLVKDWNTKHPTIDVIVNVITKLEEELQMFSQLLQFMIDGREAMAKTQTQTQTQTKTKTESQTKTKTKQKTRRNSDTSDSDDEECICHPIELKVVYLNGGSINPNNTTLNFRDKIRKIRNLIASEQPNIVVFVETWLHKEHSDVDVINQLGLQDYAIYRQDRQMPNKNSPYIAEGDLDNPVGEHMGGGVMVAYRAPREYHPTFTRDRNEDSGDNVMNFEITYRYNCGPCNDNRSEAKIGLVAVYRRPGPFRQSQSHPAQTKEEFDKLDNELIIRLQHLARDFDIRYSGYCMVGDFNWDPQEITRTAYMSDIVNGAFCHCFNLGKTHKDGRVIDHVFAKPENQVTDLRRTVELMSDHYGLIFNLRLAKDYYSSEEKCQAKSCN